MLRVAKGFTKSTCCIITHRLDQTVCTPFVYKALVDRWHPHAGEGSGLTRVPARTASCRQAGSGVAPQRLPGAASFIHQDHRAVNELAPASRGVDYSWNRSGARCCHVCPGGGWHRGNTAGAGVQVVLDLTRESKSRKKDVTHSVLIFCECVCVCVPLFTCRRDLDGDVFPR